jgi:hypothetical protein
MATINYFGLTKKSTVTVALTVTIDQLITAIAADEGLATEYYIVSSLYDPSKSSLTFGDSSTTLTQLGLVDGSTVLCTTNQTGSKQQRQIQKLDLAAAKRNEEYDINRLPTKYSGNTVVDNANIGGLIEARPWTGNPYVSASLLDDAFVYLDAGNAASYPGTGSTWSDLSGNGFDATLVGSPTFNSGEDANFTLAGGDHATLPSGFSDSFSNGFALFAIWNFGTASNYERIIDLGQGQQDDNIIVGRRDTSNTFFYQLYNGSTGGTFVQVDNAVQNNEFASYGVSLNGTDGRLYVNGSLLATQAGYSEVPSNVVRNSNFIGKSNWPSDGASTGAMAVILIFRRALTLDEMQTLHNAFAERYGLGQV